MLFAFGGRAALAARAATAQSNGWQVGLDSVPMMALGALLQASDPGALSAASWAAMAYMSAVPMGVCYLCWFAALRRLPPAMASTGTLLTPFVTAQREVAERERVLHRCDCTSL